MPDASNNDHLKNLADASNGTECDDPTYFTSKALYFFIPLIYGLPTIVCNVHIIIVIIRAKRYSTLRIAFYRIYAMMSIIISVMWCWDMVTTRFIAIGFWCNELLSQYGAESSLLAPLQFVMTYSRHSQFYAATVLSVNRMTAVVIPTSYERIWERHFLPIAVSCFILPIPTTWYLLPTKALLARYPMGGLTLTYVKLLPNPWNSVTYLTMVVGSACGIIIFIATIFTYCRLSSFKKSMGQEMGKAEVNLLLCGMINSLSTLLLAAVEASRQAYAPFYYLCNYLLDNYVFWVCTCIKQVFIDIIFVFSGWSLIFFCSGVRTAIRDLYVRRVPTPRNLITVTPLKSTRSAVA